MAGQITLGANYTTNAGGPGSTTDVVTISEAPAQNDDCWSSRAGAGTQQFLSDGNGSNFAFQASTLSAPVTLAITGPCSISGQRWQ